MCRKRVIFGKRDWVISWSRRIAITFFTQVKEITKSSAILLISSDTCNEIINIFIHGFYNYYLLDPKHYCWRTYLNSFVFAESVLIVNFSINVQWTFNYFFFLWKFAYWLVLCPVHRSKEALPGNALAREAWLNVPFLTTHERISAGSLSLALSVNAGKQFPFPSSLPRDRNWTLIPSRPLIIHEYNLPYPSLPRFFYPFRSAFLLFSTNSFPKPLHFASNAEQIPGGAIVQVPWVAHISNRGRRWINIANDGFRLSSCCMLPSAAQSRLYSNEGGHSARLVSSQVPRKYF